MSTVDQAIWILSNLCVAYLRSPSSWDVVGNPAFTPPLTTQEQATLADLQLMASFGIAANITLAEFQAIKPDLVTAKAFVGIASPTAAQSNAALKSTIRVIGALLRS